MSRASCSPTPISGMAVFLLEAVRMQDPADQQVGIVGEVARDVGPAAEAVERRSHDRVRTVDPRDGVARPAAVPPDGHRLRLREPRQAHGRADYGGDPDRAAAGRERPGDPELIRVGAGNLVEGTESGVGVVARGPHPLAVGVTGRGGGSGSRDACGGGSSCRASGRWGLGSLTRASREDRRQPDEQDEIRLLSARGTDVTVSSRHLLLTSDANCRGDNNTPLG